MSIKNNGLKGLRTIDLFAGIGGIRLGFEDLGTTCVFSSEWDNAAQNMYEAFFGERPHGDINEIRPEDIPDHDVLLAGFPCQPFSIAGKQLGFADTRGTLFFNIESILSHKRPSVVFLENVKRLRTHDKGRTLSVIVKRLESLGYHVHYTVLNTLDFGLPQRRERIYIVGFQQPLQFDFPVGVGHYGDLKDVLEAEDTIPESFFVSERIREKRLNALKKPAPSPSVWHENIGGNISPLPYSCALRAGGSYNYLLVNGQRRLTGREMMRLQGFPDSYAINVPYTQIRKIAGNSVSVPVIRAIAEQIDKALKLQKRGFMTRQLRLFE